MTFAASRALGAAPAAYPASPVSGLAAAWRSTMRSLAGAAGAALAAATLATPAVAQLPPHDPTPVAAAPRPVQPTRAVAVSALAVMGGSFAADWEQRGGRQTTWGVGVTYDSPGSLFFDATRGYDVDASLKWRYYPRSVALDGASIGFLAGATTYQRPRDARRVGDASAPPGAYGPGNDVYDPYALATARSRTVATLGFTFDYNRLYGARRQFLVGTGFGLKRRFVGRGADGAPLPVDALRPTLRLVFGHAW